jgi:hypothetical protein
VRTSLATSASAEADAVLAARREKSAVFSSLFDGSHGKTATTLAASGAGRRIDSVAASAVGDFKTRTGAVRW